MGNSCRPFEVAQGGPGDLAHWLALVKALFKEIPHLHVTRLQIKRLWDLDDALTDELLATLFASGYLVETPDHQICRATCEALHP